MQGAKEFAFGAENFKRLTQRWGTSRMVFLKFSALADFFTPAAWFFLFLKFFDFKNSVMSMVKYCLLSVLLSPPTHVIPQRLLTFVAKLTSNF